MNTVKSFWLGWGSLCVAGGGAYYFAKQQINADRQAKMDAHRKKRQMIHNLEVEQDGGAPRDDHAFSPSTEIAQDPAPTRHAPATENQRINEKSKYESSAVYRSPKGDRFS